MRPTPKEVVAGAARVLGDTVAPTVTDAHAASQLTYLIAVLRVLDPSDAAFTLHARQVELCQLLETCRDWAEPHAGRAPSFTAIPPVSDTPPTSFADINDRHETARAALTNFIGDLTRWRGEHGQPDSDELVQRIGRYLAGRRAP